MNIIKLVLVHLVMDILEYPFSYPFSFFFSFSFSLSFLPGSGGEFAYSSLAVADGGSFDIGDVTRANIAGDIILDAALSADKISSFFSKPSPSNKLYNNKKCKRSKKWKWKWNEYKLQHKVSEMEME